ncbi:MAG: family 43 glycosylhydrolase [Polyangiaceae bacterium]|nr:family 43 glycosylhydrolase [Polyangiaceae bacterium]
MGTPTFSTDTLLSRGTSLWLPGGALKPIRWASAVRRARLGALVWAAAGLLAACGGGSSQKDSAGGSRGAGTTTGGAAAGGSNSTGGTSNPMESGGGGTGGAGTGPATGGSGPPASGGTGGSSAGGTPGGGTVSSGGHSTGGLAGAGSPAGGSSTGGSSSGGTPSGGSSSGGTSSGGTSSGGSSSGGTSSGGRSSGGTSSGGRSSGGTSSGGTASGGAGGTTGPDQIVTIRNGGFWQDTTGKRIEAHGGGFILVGDTWYWVGEDKSHNAGEFKGVDCYASKDLVTWELRNAIITRDTATDLQPSDRIIERPKVVYNKKNDNYVMWLHWEGANYATAEAGVFTCDTVDGDYELVRHFRPNNNMSRDDTLFKDDDDKAYFLSASNDNADLALYELNADYTDISRQVATLWPGAYREAPALMKTNGRYFMMTSGATGWNPNQQQYATATAIAGPWSSLSNIGDSNGYDTQTTYILPVQGSSATTYIYMGDRWQDPDLVSSKYIWLPLKVSDSKLTLDKYDTWQLNLTTGEWSAGGG